METKACYAILYAGILQTGVLAHIRVHPELGCKFQAVSLRLLMSLAGPGWFFTRLTAIALFFIFVPTCGNHTQLSGSWRQGSLLVTYFVRFGASRMIVLWPPERLCFAELAVWWAGSRKAVWSASSLINTGRHFSTGKPHVPPLCCGSLS